ncbi:hypothetical protein, partial [Streptomyces mirabilis]|uniref:hypothetical protein n=1 Tax=Streptomyces mirabilis TaxID=68239 RepID=UPI0033E720C3
MADGGAGICSAAQAANASPKAAYFIPIAAAEADSTGRRNTLITEVCDGTRREAEGAGGACGS